MGANPSGRGDAGRFGVRPTNNVYCRKFNKPNFYNTIAHAIGSEYDDWLPTVQAQYLADYLQDVVNAETLVVEDHYIDRHYIEEVSLYYSKSLLPRANFTTRIHVFDEPFNDQDINDAIKHAATNGADDSTGQLQNAYCGYIVIRPLPSVPVGRTILCHPDDKDDDKFLACYKYPIHFLGFSLEVTGLPFQQQDRAVAACATTAIWSALQPIKRREGDRAPTSWAITEAASRHAIPLGRPFPSSGLTADQMCQALRNFGFAPDLVRIRGDETRKQLHDFLFVLDIYLRSGMPIILLFRTGQDEGHAVTVVGHSRPQCDDYSYNVTSSDNKQYGVRLRNLDGAKIYLHDDRSGPYVPAWLNIQKHDVVDGSTTEFLTISVLEPCEQDTDYLQEREHEIYMGVVPLYPKLRSNAKELFEASMGLLPGIASSVRTLETDTDKLGVMMYFTRSGEYQASLYQRQVGADEIVSFQKTVALSRYIGVQRWYLGDEPFLETLWDTTDTMRPITRSEENFLGVICLNQDFSELRNQIANFYNVIPG